MNFLISVCSPRALPTLTQICQELDMRLPVAALARGTAVRSMLDILGIEDNERRVVFSVAEHGKNARVHSPAAAAHVHRRARPRHHRGGPHQKHRRWKDRGIS